MFGKNVPILLAILLFTYRKIMKPNYPSANSLFSKAADKVGLEIDEIKCVEKFLERFVFAKAFAGFEMTGETRLNQSLQANLYKVVLAVQALTELYLVLNQFGYSDLDIDEVVCQNEVIFEVLSSNQKFNTYLVSNAAPDSSAISAIQQSVENEIFDVICYAKAIEEIFSLHKTNSRYLCLFNLTDQLMIKQLSEFVLDCCEMHFAKFVNWLSSTKQS